jgi:hypothetical protein
MSDNQYPVFESGQTLTAADLNMLRAFLHERDHLVARMTGFGINCGLGGVVSGTTLTIKPGLAVDQPGEPLVLTTEQTISLPLTAMTPSYDFIATSTPSGQPVGGFSVVLEATDTVVPTPDCGEADCAGHADLHTRAVTLRTVAGRVTGTRMDFAGETLLNEEPIRLELDSTPINSYTALRNAIATRLTNSPNSPLVNPTLIANLQVTSIAAGDTAGIKGYKAGWLNMVLFAALDLLRAEALMKLACDRTTSRPGVVLGWVHQVGTGWVFDCSYRHAWEPPRGLSEAFFGGTCSDPLSLYRDELEAVLAGFAPPDPVPSGPVEPPHACPKGTIRTAGGKCVSVYYPPRKIPDNWQKHWQLDKLRPRWRPPDEKMLWANPWIVYETPGWGFFEDGVIDAGDYVGRPGTEVKNVLDGYILSQGGVADLKLVTADKIEDLGRDGYLPAGGFSPSDTFVLTVDGAGKVIATGRVPAVRNTRNVGAALPAAVNAATEAKAAAGELKGIFDNLAGRFTEVNKALKGVNDDLAQLRGDFNSYKGGTFDQGGFGARLNTMENQVLEFRAYNQRISTVEGKVDVIQKYSVPETRGLSPTVGRGLAEFTKTTVAAMKSLPAVDNANFQRYTDAAEKSQTQFEATLATEDPQAIASAAVTLLGTVRTMVKASGASPELGKQLDEQLRNLGGMLG